MSKKKILALASIPIAIVLVFFFFNPIPQSTNQGINFQLTASPNSTQIYSYTSSGSEANIIITLQVLDEYNEPLAVRFDYEFVGVSPNSISVVLDPTISEIKVGIPIATTSLTIRANPQTNGGTFTLRITAEIEDTTRSLDILVVIY